ncbi:30 kDa heat shock protein [Penicillium atrosanguineum]|uniref:30 kDa heat shock protein n=1 Tax=Penicillium atrosanguineum TaxID=1132637 RepID=A0A9W9GLU0_9EURO|nr:30 kDa heat shock protein [Penicillium atrosanguineum]KAJ5321086.1 30 kDa heat shock protein [Penicillium atrosanguineum]
MAFLCNSDFRPLFRLLDDYETHRSRAAPSTSTRSYTPAFDVRELNDGYYLDGELPGVNQSNIDIEFSDPHTLVIKGYTERSYQHENTEKADSKSGARQWRQPTVEDEEADATDADSDTNIDTDSVTPETQPSFHYWASERSIGEFQRTFTFPTRVDQDAVHASLKNGILSVVVPKEAAPKTKKIRIQ